MFRKTSTKCLLVIAFLFCCKVIIAQQRSISHGCNSPSGVELSPYEPKVIHSLNALPENIRRKVADHLRARFGNEFYSKLVFSIGAVIDMDEFLRLKPNTQWKVPSYELAFNYADRKNGLAGYCARIRLDANGDVMQEINLPEVAKYPQKANVTSIDRAIEIARSRGFNPKRMNITMDYDEDVGSLVWVIDSFAFSDKYTASSKVLKIDAHSGVILKDGYVSGIK